MIIIIIENIYIYIYFQLDICPVRTTVCFIFLRKSSKMFGKLPDIPFCVSLKTKACHTELSVFNISRNTTQIS